MVSLIILIFDGHAVALDRAYQFRVAVQIWMLPFVLRDSYRLDINVGLDDCFVGDIGQPITVRAAILDILQNNGDIDVAFRMGIAAGAATK